MGRILLWTVLFFVNFIVILLGGGMLSAALFGMSVYALTDAITAEMDRREFMYERLGPKGKS